MRRIRAGWALTKKSWALLRGKIFGVAQYRFATDGDATGGFTTEELQSAVRPR
jgi:hypothetical protein